MYVCLKKRTGKGMRENGSIAQRVVGKENGKKNENRSSTKKLIFDSNDTCMCVDFFCGCNYL